MATISMIAAIGKNNELGKNNNLIWHISEDLKFFKKETLNKKVILGRKTLESLPGLLKGRTHLVLTSKHLEESENLKVFKSIEDLLKYIDTLDEEVIVIGGGKIYKDFLPYANKLILTEINDTKDADTYFPDFDKKKYEKKILCTHNESGIEYKHVIYKKKSY
jgi:dihydrofolate reductase